MDVQRYNYRDYNYPAGYAQQMIRYVPRYIARGYSYGKKYRKYIGAGAAAASSYYYGRGRNKTSVVPYGSRTSNMNYGKFYKKKNYRKKRTYKKSKISRGVKKYIKKVTQDKLNNLSTGTWRDIAPSQLSCEENQCSYASYVLLDVNQIEDAIDQMKVINVSTGNATATAMDPTTQDGLRTNIINAKSKFMIRNNGKTPCHLECRWLFVKKRMTASQTPTSVFEDGLENKLITSSEITDLRFNVYDSREYNNFFKIYKYKKYYLNPGDEIELEICRNKSYLYDPDHFDQHSASDSQPGLTQWLHFRMQGVVSHDDTTTNLVGTCDATLDVVRLTHIKFSSIMGQGFKYAVVGGGSLDTQSAGSKVNIPATDEVGETL